MSGAESTWAPAPPPPVPADARPPTVAHRAQYALLRVVVAVLSSVPLEWARRVGAGLGLLGYWPLGIRRGVVQRQLAAAFPGLDPSQVRALSRRTFAHLGRLGIEMALVSRRGPEAVLAMFDGEGDFALVRQRLAEGRGLIAFTGHVGNWELAGSYLAARGVPLDAVARRMNNRLFDAYINQARANVGMHIVHDSEAVRRIPRAIRDGRAVGLIADQGVMGLASTFVPFFGRPAKTPRGPAVFALRFKVPILFVSAMLQPGGKYRLCVEEIPVVETGDREADVDATVASFTRALERTVRRYPEQYFWHHRRWKRQPPDTPPELREPR